MEIGEPTTLARFPRSKLQQGRTFFGPVYSLSNGLKRKRQEICTSTDGESANVYDIRSGKILTSFALPPDSALTCAPCSVRSSSSNGSQLRSTYVVSKRRNEVILSVSEEQVGEMVQRSVSRSISLGDSEASVAQLEVLGLQETYQILVIREDGRYEIYNTELSSQLTCGRLGGCSPHARLVSALWLSPNQAAKSILRARPDVLASTDAGSSFILGVFYTSGSHSNSSARSIEMGIWRISQNEFPVSHSTALLPIIRQDFSITSSLLNDQDPITFASQNTRMVIRTQSKVYVTNIALATPRQAQEVAPVATDQISSIFISDSLTLSSTSATIQLHQTHLNTIQTKLDLNRVGQKRKRSVNLGGPIFLLAFFPACNRVIGYRKDHLVSIDLQVSQTEGISNFTKRTSLLVNNIGRGAISQEWNKDSYRSSECLIGRVDAPHDHINEWNSYIKQFEQNFEDVDPVDIDALIATVPSTTIQSLGSAKHIAEGYKIDYLISKIFKYDDAAEEKSLSSGRKLSLTFPAHDLLRNLAAGGHLSIERVNKVLRSSTKSQFEPVTYGTLPQLLVESDPSLQVLHSYLEQSPFLVHQELFACTLLLLRRALAATRLPFTSKAGALALSPSSETDSGTIVPTSVELDGTIPANVNSCLCIAIERLSDASQGLLSSHLRNTFSQREIIALVQFLRQQLFRSGYTRLINAQVNRSSPLSKTGLPEDASKSPGQSAMTLGAIASMLCSCMDALGPIGILSSGEDEEFVQKLIPELSSEIARATEAVRDATFLEGVLRETLRFAESAARSRIKSTINNNDIANKDSKSGAILTLYSEHPVDGNPDHHNDMLPLSLRTERRVNALKVRRGDGTTTRRSARELGMLQDRQRGPYAFERLIL